MKDFQVLLVGGDDPTYHDFSRLIPILEETLSERGLQVTASYALDEFLPDRIQKYDLIVCYTFGHHLTADQEMGLLAAVRGDPWNERARTKGFLGLHGASSSFLNSESYLRMLGGRFLVHPPLQPLQVEITQPDHPLMRGISDFTITDELYLIESYTPFQPLAICEYQGHRRPVAWAKPYGLGKVAYLGLGHGEVQLRHASFQGILLNAVDWILD